MIIPKHHLKSSSIVNDLLGESQYQPAGIDMTVKEVHDFESAGRIDFDNSSRKISSTKALQFNSNEIHLSPGSYKVIFNEYVKIPHDVAAFCFPRSSLLRCGAMLECAIWDPGYEGRSEALLIVSNKHGLTLKKNAKIGQMVFIKLSEATKEPYEGRYKGENK